MKKKKTAAASAQAGTAKVEDCNRRIQRRADGIWRPGGHGLLAGSEITRETLA